MLKADYCTMLFNCFLIGKTASMTMKGGNTQEASAKRISQAVYDIRYRAKTDKITLEAAYNSYMGNSNLTKEEKDIVKERLFGKKGGGVGLIYNEHAKRYI